MVFVPSENSVTCLIKTSIGLHVAVSIINPDNNIYHMNCFLKIIKFSSQQNQIFDFDHIQQKQQWSFNRCRHLWSLVNKFNVHKYVHVIIIHQN